MVALSYPIKSKKLGYQKMTFQSEKMSSGHVANSTIGYDGQVNAAVVFANSTIGYDGQVNAAVVFANSTIGYDGEVK
jgi:ADP-glucose pyrophosphorylase